MKNSKFKTILMFLLVAVISFTMGYFVCAHKYDSRRIHPESFDNLIEEYSWQREQNDFLFELIYNYDAALYTTDSIVKQYCMYKIDSIYKTIE